jgi:hypothetical protein
VRRVQRPAAAGCAGEDDEEQQSAGEPRAIRFALVLHRMEGRGGRADAVLPRTRVWLCPLDTCVFDTHACVCLCVLGRSQVRLGEKVRAVAAPPRTGGGLCRPSASKPTLTPVCCETSCILQFTVIPVCTLRFAGRAAAGQEGGCRAHAAAVRGAGGRRRGRRGG